MHILALDSAGASCSAALTENGEPIGFRHTIARHGHAALLAPMVAEILNEAGVTASAVDRFAVTVGPGGFTGLRIGLATARGLALASGCPLVGITTFALWRALCETPERMPTMVAIDSRRQEIFAQLFDPDGRQVGAPSCRTPIDIANRLALDRTVPLCVAGDAADALADALQTAGWQVHRAARDPNAVPALTLARLALSIPGEPGHMVAPLYLRAPDARLPAATAGAMVPPAVSVE